MASARPRTPGFDSYTNGKSYGPGIDSTPVAGKAMDTSPLANATGVRPNSGVFSYAPGDDLEIDGPTVQQLEGAGLHRAASSGSRPGVSRSNTLKKQTSLSRKSSLKRSGSRKSLAAGSIKGVQIEDRKYAPGDEYNSAFYCPVPTSGSPTEILANRFQTWRKFLKDLIAYFKEVQTSYEHKSKALLKVSNVINNTAAPSIFLSEGGLNDANRILRDYHKLAVSEANKAREIEDDVITQLAGLRADLGQKIKEIKSLSGDFKNSVEKEKDHTRRAVNGLQEALAVVDRDADALVGKEDPYIIKLGVDRQIERQIDEENYLHRAYLNLEGSGRELEAIVVGEVQKAYNALAGILKREADESYNAIEQLRSGPITLPKEHEWSHFIYSDPHFISADTPLRKVENIEYPGKNHPAAAEVRAGMLERKSKYLKSYTPGWYVLSPTHLHEFKSADRIYSQPPVMSLLLSDQKLGSHSQPDSSSHKFMLKGRQTGAMHRGHSWVFRAESYETMLAWFDDIRAMTEKTGEERNAFVRKHARSFSHGSQKASSVSGDSGLEEDEADEVPFSARSSILQKDGSIERAEGPPRRPEPGGRFPSDLNINRHLHKPLSHSSGSSIADNQDLTTMAGGLQSTHAGPNYDEVNPAYQRDPVPPTAASTTKSAAAYPPAVNPYDGATAYQQPPASTYTGPLYNPATSAPPPATAVAPAPVANTAVPPPQTAVPPPSQQPFLAPEPSQSQLARHSSDYASWMAPAAAGTAVGAGGAIGIDQYLQHRRAEQEAEEEKKRQAAFVPVAEPSSQPQTEAISATDMALPVEAPAKSAALAPAESTLLAGLPTPSPAATASRADNDGTTSILSEDTVATELTESEVGTAEVHTAYDTNPDGSVNAKPTGRIFPTVLRHNTDTSISNLHIPGEFPRGAAA